MREGIALLAALLVATSALAAEPKKDPKRKADEKAQPAETPQEKLERLRAARGSAPPDPKKAAAAAERAAALRAKSVYFYAVESCQQPSRCDPALRDDAEQRFMDACRTCATDDRCDAERAAIKAGTAKRSANPCAP